MRGLPAHVAVIAGWLALMPPVMAGHTPERSGIAAVASDEKARGPRRSTCERLETLVGKLGETYAGHRLRETWRETWAARVCAMTHRAFDDGIWSWPWGRSGHALLPNDANAGVRALPPLLLQTFGAWDVRCGRVGTRQRCALVRIEMLRMPDDSNGVRVISHFVIDAVAGREITLWRVHVERANSDVGVIVVRLPQRALREPFDQCGTGGCIMEAEINNSAAIATRLWSGEPVEVAVGGLEDSSVVVLPAKGFREGFNELVRLRREDRGQVFSGSAP